MTSLSMPPKKQKPPVTEAQLTLSPLFSHNRANITPREAADALSVTPRQVIDLVDCGKLRAFAINDRPLDPRSGREHLRIIRSSVEAYWLERYREKNGVEFPLVNSPEVAAMREHLRSSSSSSSKS